MRPHLPFKTWVACAGLCFLGACVAEPYPANYSGSYYEYSPAYATYYPYHHTPHNRYNWGFWNKGAPAERHEGRAEPRAEHGEPHAGQHDRFHR